MAKLELKSTGHSDNGHNGKMWNANEVVCRMFDSMGRQFEWEWDNSYPDNIQIEVVTIPIEEIYIINWLWIKMYECILVRSRKKYILRFKFNVFELSGNKLEKINHISTRNQKSEIIAICYCRMFVHCDDNVFIVFDLYFIICTTCWISMCRLLPVERLLQNASAPSNRKLTHSSTLLTIDWSKFMAIYRCVRSDVMKRRQENRKLIAHNVSCQNQGERKRSSKEMQ